MNRQTFNKILQINKDFYDCVAEEFDTSRQYAWKGWEKVLSEINSHIVENQLKSIKVLDLGCGNGRFYKFLAENIKINIDYVGVDNNNKLLKYAKAIETREGDNVNFVFGDVLGDLSGLRNKIRKSYNFELVDIVVAFGVTHHIPSNEHRNSWTNNILELRGHITILTFWNPTNTKQFRPLSNENIEKVLDIDLLELDEGDYFLKWGKDTSEKDCIRYVHIWKEDEIKTIDKNSKIFCADGKDNKLNIYQISTKELDL